LRPAPSWRRRKAPSHACAAITGETWKLCAGLDNNQTLGRQAAVAGGGLRRVAKRGELAGSPSPAQRRTARTIVTSRHDAIQEATSSALLIKLVTARGPARREFRGV
jgi:hypothetical protein